MTKDFRNIGLTSTKQEAAERAPAAALPPSHQRLILRIVLLTALGFLAAGLWLLTGGTSPFPAQTSFYLGIALTMAGLSDFIVIAVLKRAWSRPR